MTRFVNDDQSKTDCRILCNSQTVAHLQKMQPSELKMEIARVAAKL